MSLKSNLEAIVSQHGKAEILKAKWINDISIGSGFYYSITYNPILSFFHSHKPLDEELELKIALVFSWNPKICEVNEERFTKAKSKLHELRDIQSTLDGKIISACDLQRHFYPLWDALKLATCSSDAAPGVSITKYLHYSFPNIFPMIDLNTMRLLRGKSTYNKNAYKEFLLAWKDIFETNQGMFESLSESLEMPYARILDIIIFNPK